MVAILECVFDLKVDLEGDIGIIRDGHRRPALMMETQSTELNVTRESIDQIRRDGQSMGLSESMPAIPVHQQQRVDPGHRQKGRGSGSG